MKHICLWGTSLAKVGDAGLLYAARTAVQSVIPDAKVTVFARHGEVIERRFPGIEAMKTARLDKVASRLAGADLLVFVGGPFIEYPAQALSCFILFFLAKIFGVPTVTYGSTFIDYKTAWGKFFFPRLLEAMDEVTVREQVGLELLRKHGVRKAIGLYADPRFIIDSASEEECRRLFEAEGIDTNKPIVGISTRDMPANLPEWIKRSHGYTKERAENAYAAIAEAAQRLPEDVQCVLIPMHPAYASDVRTAERIRAHLREPQRIKILTRSYDPVETLGIMAACEMVIASRLVSAVFATSTATPVVSIAHESRMTGHMNGIGLSNYVTDWKEVNPREFADLTAELWEEREVIKEKLRGQATTFRQSAWENAAVMTRHVKPKVTA